jgi:hypothetical protein
VTWQRARALGTSGLIVAVLNVLSLVFVVGGILGTTVLGVA